MSYKDCVKENIEMLKNKDIIIGLVVLSVATSAVSFATIKVISGIASRFHRQ